MGFSIEEKEEMITLAKKAIEGAVKGERIEKYVPENKSLEENRGAFVTIKKNNNLRGCIGYVLPYKPLFETIIEVAESAAMNDPRFPSVTIGEINELNIEISVLTVPEKIEDIEKIEVGKHGIILEKSFFKGLLLPQVATEYGWDRNTFLEHTALKAGLDKDGWKDAEIKIFSAEVFGEKDI